MKKYKIVHVVGARPNFVKLAPLLKAYKKYPIIKPIVIHTGQHFDKLLSESFFKDLSIPKPDYNLGINRKSVIGQIGRIMIRLENIFKTINPDLVVVVGDANPSISGALTAKYLGIPIAHVESGLRSGDLSMPEEINRIITDRLADILFTSEGSGTVNLQREGVDKNKIFFVGNIMIDTLKQNLSKIKKIKHNYSKPYIVMTIHRPANVDTYDNLFKIISTISSIKKIGYNIIFPIHPRTYKNIRRFNLLKDFKNQVIVTEPLGYFEFISLVKNSKLVLTDSGGVQEETSWLKIPCLTIRETTERPVTVSLGTNTLLPVNSDTIVKYVRKISQNKYKKGCTIPYTDGRAAIRIVQIISKYLIKKYEETKKY